MSQVGEIIMHSEGSINVLFDDDASLWLTSELLETVLFRPENFTYMSVSRASDGHGSTGHGWREDCQATPGMVCFANAIVKISNGQQNWVYKVLDYDMCKNAWHARWPD